jgi:hypothetical protein
MDPLEAFGRAVYLHLPALYACGYAGVKELPAGLMSSFTLLALLREGRAEAELEELLEQLPEGLLEISDHLDGLALEAGIQDRAEGRPALYSSSALVALRPFLNDLEVGFLISALDEAI